MVAWSVSVPEPLRPEWIAVDWGTTHLRVRAMSGASVLARADSADGMGGLAPDGFEPALMALIADWLGDATVPVICCGMAGARQGWAEAPYAPVPADPHAAPAVRVPSTEKRLAVHILGGLSQANPADVMRGEETQIAGFIARNPGWDGVLCLPGTHSKWAQISAGEVVSFQTFMTGEMFATLATQTVLRHSVAAEGWDEAAFDTAVDDTLSRPEKLAAALFRLRAESLLHSTDPEAARARLSGLLIGAELAAARPYWLGQNIAVIGNRASAQAYLRALAAQGCQVTEADAEAMTLAGLTAAWRKLKGRT